MARRTYDGDGIRVLWNSELCIHSAVCLQGLPEVFDLDARPWVNTAAADADAIADLIERCPSGALAYERTDGTDGEVAAPAASVVPWPDGPLLVRGTFEVLDHDGQVFETGMRAAFCRCGASANQPFCDASHRRVGFRNNPHVISDARQQANAPDETVEPD